MEPSHHIVTPVVGVSVTIGSALVSFLTHTLIFVQYGAALVSLIVGVITLATLVRNWLRKPK